MLLANSLLAFSLLAAPAKPCNAPVETGIYRITALTKDSLNSRVGMILLESVNDCLEVSIVTDDAGPAMLDVLDIKGDVLTGRVHMPGGMADVTLTLTPTTISGSIVEKHQHWDVSGRRTSGTELRRVAGSER